VFECRQGLLVILRPVRVEQHPDPQVPRLDFGVVTVLQQHGLPHCAAGEACPHLVINLAFDPI